MVSYLKAFGCKCFVVLNNGPGRMILEYLMPSDEAVFVGYPSTSMAYRVYNKRTLYWREYYIIFDEYGDIENLNDRDDLEIEELLRV